MNRSSDSVESPRPIGLTSKRVIDIILAISGIILLAPLLIICFVVTIATSPGPALFRHRRVGFNGKYFDCLKFRTMVTDAPERLRQLLESDPVAAAEWAANRKLRHDPRVTAIGDILRRSSLDELPQLFNVIRGDMSLVGPRPHAASHNTEYEKQISNYAFRYHMLPGITGWAQIHGLRGETKTLDRMVERVEADLWYINNWSFLLDLKILLRTLVLGIQSSAY